ncbi:MAG: hypothetical protein OXS30_11975 [Chloroflexota bacterium]|nr:hypothetical protein [Chloroflexota bacterium]
MTRTLLLTGLLALIGSALLVGAGAVGAHDDDDGETVRIIARLQSDGDIEFGLRTSEGRQLPQRRIFLASVRSAGWKWSSLIPLVNGAEVRIIARREGETRVEFGLRTDDPPRVFLPTRRKFSRSTPVGDWRVSSALLIPAPVQDEEEEESETPVVEPEEETERSEPEEDTPSVERISGGHRDGLAVVNGVLGEPDAPVLIVEYGDPF